MMTMGSVNPPPTFPRRLAPQHRPPSGTARPPAPPDPWHPLPPSHVSFMAPPLDGDYLHLRPPPHLLDRAREELGETDETRADALSTLTRTLTEQAAAGHTAAAAVLGGLAADAPFLLTFLRWAKFSLPVATARLASFAAFVGAHEWAAAPDEATLRRVYEHGALSFTPHTTIDGRVVLTLLAGPLLGLIEDVGLDVINRAAFWAFCALLRDPEVAISGVVFVEDLRGCMDTRMVAVVRSKENAFGWRMMQQVLPLRLQGVYFLYQPPGVGVLWAVLARLFAPKLRRRVRMLGRNRAALEALMPPASLPVSMDGEAVEELTYSSELALAGLRATPWMGRV